MNYLDIPTAYVVVGMLFLLGPASGWLVLSPGQSRTIVMWSLGGLLFGVGMLLIGARAHIPSFLSYPLAVGLSTLGLCMKADALSRELGKPWRMTFYAIGTLVHAAVFDAFRSLGLSDLRFAWGASATTVLFAVIAWLGFQLARTGPSPSARWLGLAYSLGAFFVGARVLGVLTGHIDPEVVSQSVASISSTVAGVLVSYVGTLGFVGMFLDRSRRHELEAVDQRARQEEATRLGAQIAQLDRVHVMNELSGSLAHELNQPLAAILTNAQLARHMAGRSGLLPGVLIHMMNEIERDTQRASQMLLRIRNFVRKSSEDRSPVSMQRIVKEATDILAADLRRAKVSVSTELPGTPVMVMGEKLQLLQVLLNLMINAVQAMAQSEKREMECLLRVEQKEVLLVLRDHGPGFPVEHLDKIDAPFFTTKPDGMGLGLPIARSIVEQHGGKLHLANAPQGGARVEVKLPLLSSSQ